MKKGLIGVFVIMMFTGCAPQVDDGKIDVVATVGMLGDVVRNVGGDFVEVTDLMGPGVDPHLYKASFNDTALIEDAEAIFYVGIDLEAKMAEFLEGLEGKPVVPVAEVIDENLLREKDPHIWFDVDLWAKIVPPIVETLSEMDPANAEIYAANGENYLAELADLEIWVRDYTAQLPMEKRVLVTAHDAFGYFGDAYGFEVLGVQGISTASDYGLKDLERLIDTIVEREVKAIFVESSVSSQSIEALQEGVLAKGFAVEIGGQLFSDAMGALGTEQGTYVGMVKYNVKTIVDALK